LSTVLGRERAIVINLEHVKAIITAHEVLLLNSKDPYVTPFVEELQGRLMFHYHAIKAQVFDMTKRLMSSPKCRSVEVTITVKTGVKPQGG
jgi:magnesium transporter